MSESKVFLEIFLDRLGNNECPFCEKKLEWYEGLLGYEAWICKGHISVDYAGIHIEKELIPDNDVDKKAKDFHELMRKIGWVNG